MSWTTGCESANCNALSVFVRHCCRVESAQGQFQKFEPDVCRICFGFDEKNDNQSVKVESMKREGPE